ncbi:hypothetical protein BC831DRAFT_205491 [Entophlyctis helioformis]|nr:hypothetical protein BC831DRAFT_205491 [Entophlyctis helioformis]
MSLAVPTTQGSTRSRRSSIAAPPIGMSPGSTPGLSAALLSLASPSNAALAPQPPAQADPDDPTQAIPKRPVEPPPIRNLADFLTHARNAAAAADKERADKEAASAAAALGRSGMGSGSGSGDGLNDSLGTDSDRLGFGRSARGFSTSGRWGSGGAKKDVETIEEVLAVGPGGRRMTLVPAEGGILRVDMAVEPARGVELPASGLVSERGNLPTDTWPKVDASAHELSESALLMADSSFSNRPSVTVAGTAGMLLPPIRDAYIKPDDLKTKLTGIIPMGQRELEMLGEHVNLLTSNLRIGHDLAHLSLAADDPSQMGGLHAVTIEADDRMASQDDLHGGGGGGGGGFTINHLNAMHSAMDARGGGGGRAPSISIQQQPGGLHSAYGMPPSNAARLGIPAGLQNLGLTGMLGAGGMQSLGSTSTSNGSPFGNGSHPQRSGLGSFSNGGMRRESQSLNMTAAARAGISSRQASQMVEHAEYTRFSEALPPMLPNGVMPSTHLMTALKARPNVTPNLVKKWRKYLTHDRSMYIMVESFWYFFLRLWRPERQDDMDDLINKISYNYVQMFLRFRGDDKDDFFQALPDMYAQSLYTAFRECFPQSHKHFDVNFQTLLCDELYHLLSGITPFNPPCMTWPTEIVMSKITRKTDDDDADLPQRHARTNADAAGRQPGDLDMLKPPPKHAPSSYMGASTKTTRVNFNIYQTSPIVSRYLTSHGITRDARTVTIHRREAIRVDPAKLGLQTYRQIVADSTRASKRAIRSYKASQEEAMRERNRVAGEMSALLVEEQKRALRILSRPQEVKTVADQILEVYATRDTSRRESRMGTRGGGGGGGGIGLGHRPSTMMGVMGD